MNSSRTILLVLICVFSCSWIASAQPRSKFQRQAESYIKKEKYSDALPLLLQVDTSEYSSNPKLLYDIGVCYFYHPTEKEKGVGYLNRYLTYTDTMHQAYYYLAKLHHLQFEFEKASENYVKFTEKIVQHPFLPEPVKSELIENAEREIDHCKFGAIAIKNPRNAVIENLGDSINTEYPEYAPVISRDEKHFIFTSRRPDTKGGKIAPDNQYFEDIYHSNLKKGSIYDRPKVSISEPKSYYFNLITDFDYTTAVKMGGEANSNTHDGSIQLSANDSILYFYRDFDVWHVNIEDTLNSHAVRMPNVVNNDNAYEPSIFFSYDGEELFIVSDREGGYGGLDIWVSEKSEDGTWKEAVNMGPTINSEYDEDAPYLDPDDTTFYFSSRGHTSMGDYDIFRAKRVDSSWSSPVNIGFPINTPAEDVYFIMTDRYNRGYYASGNLGGKGDMDLYRITFADERDPVAELLGLVLEGDSLVPARSKITMTTTDGLEKIEQVTDTVEGDYLLLLGHGKVYDMVVETENFVPYHKRFEIPEQKLYFQLYQEVHHVYLYDEDGNVIGQKITIYNAMGESDTISTYYDRARQEMINKMFLSDSSNRDIDIYTDVKFYITEDSLAKLMQNDSTLQFNFPTDATVSFVETDNSDKDDLASYVEPKSIYEEGKIVLNNVLSDSTLETELDETKIEAIDAVLYFDYDKHTITASDQKSLKYVIEYLKRHESVSVMVVGHTDSRGSDAYNYALSQRRADAVKLFLTSQGIDKTRVTTEAKGESELLFNETNSDGSDNAENRRKNRRVEFKFSNLSKPGSAD